VLVYNYLVTFSLPFGCDADPIAEGEEAAQHSEWC